MATDPATTKILLDERDIPTHWYNVVPDLPEPPAPVLHPGTGRPIGPADLAPLFPMALIGQYHRLRADALAPGDGGFRIVFLAPPDQLERIYEDIAAFTAEFLAGRRSGVGAP